MPLLDHCVGSTYEPGNIGSSSGVPPVVVILRPLPPPSYDPSVLTYSLDFSQYFNSMYHHYGEH